MACGLRGESACQREIFLEIVRNSGRSPQAQLFSGRTVQSEARSESMHDLASVVQRLGPLRRRQLGRVNRERTLQPYQSLDPQPVGGGGLTAGWAGPCLGNRGDGPVTARFRPVALLLWPAWRWQNRRRCARVRAGCWGGDEWSVGWW